MPACAARFMAEMVWGGYPGAITFVGGLEFGPARPHRLGIVWLQLAQGAIG